MTFRRVRGALLLMALVVAAVPACASSSGDDDDDDDDDDSGGSVSARCVTYCDDTQSAMCADIDHGACVGSCADLADMEKDTSQCAAEIDRLLDCIGGLGNVCDASVVDPDTGKLAACNAESQDFAACFADYCQDHTSADYCS
jgi:hypothetical protein